jgi:hypothetical protein
MKAVKPAYEILPQFRCAVSVIRGELHLCRLFQDGSLLAYGGIANWIPVEPPVGTEFIEAANRALGTRFSVAEFQRKAGSSKPRTPRPATQPRLQQ